MTDFHANTTISIAIMNGQQMAVYAEDFGQFAVHPAVGADTPPDSYSVTHITTGLVVRRDMPLDRARDLAQRLQVVPKFIRCDGEAWLAAAAVIRKVVFPNGMEGRNAA